jgi:hypothetical protein
MRLRTERAVHYLALAHQVIASLACRVREARLVIGYQASITEITFLLIEVSLASCTEPLVILEELCYRMIHYMKRTLALLHQKPSLVHF